MTKTNYRADLILNFNDQPAPEIFRSHIIQVCVEESLYSPGSFSIVLKNDSHPERAQDTTWEYKRLVRKFITQSVQGF